MAAEARGAPTGCFTGRLYPNWMPRRPGSSVSHPCLFREATQLKTMATAVRMVEIEVLRTEVQEYAISFFTCGRPTVSVVADVVQFAIDSFAEARGGVSPARLFREATIIGKTKSVNCAKRKVQKIYSHSVIVRCSPLFRSGILSVPSSRCRPRSGHRCPYPARAWR